MIHSSLRLGLIVLAGLGTAGFAANAASGNSDLSCGVHTTTSQGMTQLEGVVQSAKALTGDYRMTIKRSGNGGSSNVSQGGPFSANAGVATSLGQSTLSSGGKLDVQFTVTAGGKTYDCSGQYGGTT